MKINTILWDDLYIMKSLWSGLGGIKEKAGEALNVAKKSLKEMASEPSEETMYEKSIDHEKEDLKNQNNLLNEEIKKKINDIQQLQKQLETLKKTPTLPIADNPNKLLDFRIVICIEETAVAIEIAENSKAEAKLIKTELEKERDNYKGLLESFKKLEKTNHGIIQEKNDKINSIKNLEEKLSKKNEIIDEMQEQITSLQDAMLNYRRKISSNIETCYNHIKESCAIIGQSIPQIKVENVGIEDIQEFLFIQTQFILENISKIYIALSGKFDMQNIKSLDQVKDKIIHIIDESSKKLLEFKEISNAAENMFQQAKKENLEILKRNNEFSKALDEIKKKLAKKEEEILKLKEDVKGFEDLQGEYEKATLAMKKANENASNIEKEFTNEKKKFEKTYSYVSTLEEEHAELKQRVKILHINNQEKDKILQGLNDEKIKLAEKYAELQQKSSNQLAETKTLYENKIKELTERYNSEKKFTDEQNSQQIADLQYSLSKAINETKDLNIAKIHIDKYQQGMERLQEAIKSLEAELRHCLSKIERLSQENEGFTSKISKKTEVKHLKLSNQLISEELQRKVQETDAEKYNAEIKLQEAEEMKKQAEILLEKVQSKIQIDDNMIDRRLVTTFLINFMNEENTEKMKIQMLKPLAEMLGMSHEEKLKIGLEQDQGLLAQFTNFLTRG